MGNLKGNDMYTKRNITKYLPDIRAWAQQGLTRLDVARKLNISKSTYYDYCEKYPEFRKAYDDGLDDMFDDIEGSLYQSTRKQELREIWKDETGAIVKEFIKEIPANQKAIEYTLNNRRPEKWRGETRTIDISLSERTKEKLSNLTEDQLIALTKLEDKDE